MDKQLKDMSVVELKATIFDINNEVARLTKAREVISNELIERNKPKVNSEVKETEKVPSENGLTEPSK